MHYNRIPAWFLAVLVLFGQTVTLVHAAEHDALASEEHCAQCLTQSVYDGKLAVAVHIFPSLHVAVAPSSTAVADYYSHQTLTLHARAPPISPA